MSTKVLLADDHEMVRKAILQFLEAEGAHDIQILAQAGSFAQTLELASELRPQVILLDIHMRDMDAVVPAQLASALKDPHVLAMSLWIDDETKTFADAIGAVALLDKANLDTQLIPALRSCTIDPNGSREDGITGRHAVPHRDKKQKGSRRRQETQLGPSHFCTSIPVFQDKLL